MKNLFKARLRQLKNTVSHSGKRKYVLFFLFAAAMWGLIGYVGFKVFGFLYHQDEFPRVFKLFVSEKILTMNFLTMFMMLILSALVSTLNIFFLSRDLHLLLSSPIRARTVFIWKGMEVGFGSAAMVVFFSLPILFSYSYYFAPGFGDILAGILIFLLYIVCGVLLGIIVGMIIPAFFSVKKLQPVLSLVGIFFISAIVIFLRMLRPEQFGNPDVINNMLNYMAGMNISFMDYFPFSWISKALRAIAEGNYWGYWKATGAFTGMIVLLTAFILFLQKKYYLVLFDKLNKGSRGGYRSTWKKSFFIRGTYAPLWKKEIKTFIRTPAQWSQLLIIGAIMIVFVLNIKGIPTAHTSVKTIIAYLNLGMAAFVVSGLNSRFTFPSIPMESPGVVHLLASPFKRGRLLHFKFLFFAVPQMIIGFVLFLMGDVSLGIDAFARGSGFVFLLPVLPFLTVLSLFYSLKIKETVPLTPNSLLTSRSGISYMLWSMAYIVLGMIYFLRPLFLYYYNRFREQPIPVLEITLWFAGFVVLNVIIMTVLYRRGLSTWNNKEFSES